MDTNTTLEHCSVCAHTYGFLQWSDTLVGMVGYFQIEHLPLYYRCKSIIPIQLGCSKCFPSHKLLGKIMEKELFAAANNSVKSLGHPSIVKFALHTPALVKVLRTVGWPVRHSICLAKVREIYNPLPLQFQARAKVFRIVGLSVLLPTSLVKVRNLRSHYHS